MQWIWIPTKEYLKWKEFNVEIIDLQPLELNVKWQKTLNQGTINLSSTVCVVYACMCVSLVFWTLVISGFKNNNNFRNLPINSITYLVYTYQYYQVLKFWDVFNNLPMTAGKLLLYACVSCIVKFGMFNTIFF